MVKCETKKVEIVIATMVERPKEAEGDSTFNQDKL